VRSFAEGYAEAIGEAAKGVGNLGCEGGDLVEGEDPVLAGESVKAGESLGEGRAGGSAGVDQGAEDAYGESLAGGGRALEDQKGERTVGAESAEEPSKAGDPGRAIGDVETGAEYGKGRGRIGVCGLGERRCGDGGVEEGVFARGDFPLIGGDDDETAFGGGEIEQDFAGDRARAA
jgi:hypothetical protein